MLLVGECCNCKTELIVEKINEIRPCPKCMTLLQYIHDGDYWGFVMVRKLEFKRGMKNE